MSGIRRKTNGFIHRMSYVFRLVAATAGVQGWIAPLYYVAEGLFPPLLAILSANLFDAAAVVAQGASTSPAFLWRWCAAIAAAFVARGALEFIGSLCINAGVYERCTAYLHIRLAQKLSKLPMLAQEDPHIHDMVQRARECVQKERISAAYMVASVFLTNGGCVVLTAVVLARYSLWILPISLLSVVPFLLAYHHMNTKLLRMARKQSKVKRRRDYYWSLLTTPQSVRELRMLDAVPYINTKWTRDNEAIQEEEYRYNRLEATLSLLCTVVQVLGVGAGLLLAYLLVAHGQISIGMFGACAAAFTSLQNCARTFFTEFANLRQNLGYVQFFRDFMELPEEGEEGEPMTAFTGEIVCENVSFTYPHCGSPALKHLNLTVPRGKSVAIVGENGSGKTTLAKLLTGLLPPDQSGGQIRIDGRDVRKRSAPSYQRNISLVSQDFVRYALTLRENVGISDVERLQESGEILSCLGQVGCQETQLDAQVGKLFQGLEFSGGEWQRIAIARAIFRRADIFVLDEPTSALDPMMEAEILRQFLHIMKHKTCVVISHRIGLCRHVDFIAVMQDGQIVETGSHQQLMQKRGAYYALFMKQSQWYR